MILQVFQHSLLQFEDFGKNIPMPVQANSLVLVRALVIVGSISDLFHFLRFLFILVMEIHQADNSYHYHHYRYNNGSHYFSSFFSLSNIRPVANVIYTAITTSAYIYHAHSFIPLKSDVNNTAVVMYLAISKNHFPNSFFIRQK